MQVRPQGGWPELPGSGLPLWLWIALLIVSVAIFLTWGGPLWHAPRDASQVMRFVVSYLAVLPLATLALLAVKQLSGSHLFVSVGTIWCVKMVVTATFYQVFARGTGQQLVPVAPQAAERRAASSHYVPASSAFASGVVRGEVSAPGVIANAAVFIADPGHGRALDPSRTVPLNIAKSRYDEPLYAVFSEDQIIASSEDPILHTVHVHAGARSLVNRPLPPGTSVTLPPIEPGVYFLRCDNHPDETAWLLVVGHPYLTRSAPNGSFSLVQVPAGPRTLVAILPSGERVERAITVEANTTIDTTLEIHTNQHALKEPPAESR